MLLYIKWNIFGAQEGDSSFVQRVNCPKCKGIGLGLGIEIGSGLGLDLR